MFTEEKLNKWRLLLILSCLIGIIAPTLIITAFALFDPSIIIVKISILQTYNLNVRRWETTYKKDFASHKFYLYMNESVGFDTIFDSSSSIGNSSNSSSSSENSEVIIDDSSVISSSFDSDSMDDSLSSGENSFHAPFIQTNIAEHVSYPTTEMIQLYTPLVFGVNTSNFLPNKLKLNPKNFHPYNVTLYLFVRKPSANHLTFVSTLSFPLFKKLPKPNDDVKTTHSTLHNYTSNGAQSTGNSKPNIETEGDRNDSLVNNNSILEEHFKKSIFQVFDNACFVYKDSVLLAEPCKYKSSVYNYTNIKHFNETLYFNSTNIRIKSYRDPYILAGNLTEGSYTFAMSKETQRHLGVAFLISGCVAFLLFLVIVWIVVKMKRYQTSLDKIDDINTNQFEMEEYGHSPNNSNNNENSPNNNNNNNSNNHGINGAIVNRNRNGHYQSQHYNRNTIENITSSRSSTHSGVGGGSDTHSIHSDNRSRHSGNNRHIHLHHQHHHYTDNDGDDLPNFYSDNIESSSHIQNLNSSGINIGHSNNLNQNQQLYPPRYSNSHSHGQPTSSSYGDDDSSPSPSVPLHQHYHHHHHHYHLGGSIGSNQNLSYDDEHDLISAEDEQRFQQNLNVFNFIRRERNNSQSINSITMDNDSNSIISHSRSTNQANRNNQNSNNTNNTNNTNNNHSNNNTNNNIDSNNNHSNNNNINNNELRSSFSI
ncbi:hypothetical protein DICPUDRAFT_158789 [Dictyostelium purpureum]|uniref:Uncharacterized protein n=1 Tax=Dictyostelium purpureum TaxID=5786 RepID=F1A2H5_DICPU|nr:uncharacterized protein DICPUDRAFT_158789 [Dictyostelium purpureum]EGC29603.1 hypothetical protein DICPUDRAFT_158789 [Dictyostelium purpureum]|eukprot:XP_003293871.1 hypothetical protein DICPUDRAFT_158789 [Dictyostelium purpureum]